MDIKELDILGNNIGDHWYYWAKARALSQWIQDLRPKTILDVGAGSGFFSSYLLENTSVQEAWCVDINYENDSDTLHCNKPVHYRRSIEQTDVELILFMDVLEHVEDDIALIREYVNKVPQGTRIVISVPAFQFLWSNHDIFLGHKRRYTLKKMIEIIESSNLLFIDGSYYYGFVFPIAATLRCSQKIKIINNNEIKSQLKKHNPAINFILKNLCKIELPVMRYNKFTGITVFCLAEKK